MIPPYLTLSNKRYVSRVKWSNPGKAVASSPTPRCSSYWKGSLLVAFDYSRQLWPVKPLSLFIYVRSLSWIKSKPPKGILLSLVIRDTLYRTSQKLESIDKDFITVSYQLVYFTFCAVFLWCLLTSVFCFLCKLLQCVQLIERVGPTLNQLDQLFPIGPNA